MSIATQLVKRGAQYAPTIYQGAAPLASRIFGRAARFLGPLARGVRWAGPIIAVEAVADYVIDSVAGDDDADADRDSRARDIAQSLANDPGARALFPVRNGKLVLPTQPSEGQLDVLAKALNTDRAHLDAALAEVMDTAVNRSDAVIRALQVLERLAIIDDHGVAVQMNKEEALVVLAAITVVNDAASDGDLSRALSHAETHHETFNNRPTIRAIMRLAR